MDEYRPYLTDDPSFAKLRGELGMYNSSDEVVDGPARVLAPAIYAYSAAVVWLAVLLSPSPAPATGPSSLRPG